MTPVGGRHSVRCHCRRTSSSTNPLLLKRHPMLVQTQAMQVCGLLPRFHTMCAAIWHALMDSENQRCEHNKGLPSTYGCISLTLHQTEGTQHTTCMPVKSDQKRDSPDSLEYKQPRAHICCSQEQLSSPPGLLKCPPCPATAPSTARCFPHTLWQTLGLQKYHSLQAHRT